MKVLVTGGAGYIGSVVSRLLLAEGHEVRVLDSLVHGGASMLGLYGEERFSFVHGDLRDGSVRRRGLDNMDAVVHLAAIVGDPACLREPELARAVNVDATLALYREASRAGMQRFVFASTCSNYGKMPDPAVLATEQSELRPVSWYAETKVAVEKELLGTNGFRPVTTVLRFATIYGISPRMRFDLTVNEFTMELMTKKTLKVFGEQFWRPYVHVRDAARAVVIVLEAPAEKVRSNVFNVGDSRENYQKKQLVDLILAELPEAAEVQYVCKEEDPRDYRVSFEKIAKTLGYRITRTVPTGIKEVIQAIDDRIFTDFDQQHYRN